MMTVMKLSMCLSQYITHHHHLHHHRHHHRHHHHHHLLESDMNYFMILKLVGFNLVIKLVFSHELTECIKVKLEKIKNFKDYFFCFSKFSVYPNPLIFIATSFWLLADMVETFSDCLQRLIGNSTLFLAFKLLKF